MLDGAIGGKIFNDFSIDEEEDLDLIFRQVGVFVFVVELDGGVKQGLPDLFGVVLLADIDCVVQDFLDLDVRGEVLFIVIVSTLQDAIDSEGCDAD